MKYVYKVIAVIMALAVIPVALFTPVFYYRFQSTAIQTLLYLGQKMNLERVNDLLEGYDTLPDTVADSVSLTEAADLISPIVKEEKEKKENQEPKEANEAAEKAFETIKVPLITSAIFFFLILICALVTAVLVIVCKNNRKGVYSSLIGAGLSVMFSVSFGSLVSPVVNGEINLSTITGMNSLIGSVLVNIQELSLTAFYWSVPVLFAGIAIWTLLYNVTLPEKEKLERKRMLGEYTEE